MEYLGQELFEQGGDDWQSLVKMGEVHLKLLVLAGIGVGDEGEEVGEGQDGVNFFLVSHRSLYCPLTKWRETGKVKPLSMSAYIHSYSIYISRFHS